MNPESEISYSSDVIIRDPCEIASLCVFYDKVFLPYLPPDIADLLLRIRMPREQESPKTADLFSIPGQAEYVQAWERRHEPLFQTVLARLGAPKHNFELSDADLAATHAYLSPNIRFGNQYSYFAARVIHLLRDDHRCPQLYRASRVSANRELYKSIMAKEAFSIRLPALADLQPDEILQVREKVAATREGFAMHLQKLSREVEERCSAGDDLEAIRAHAKAMIETDLIPDYVEFRRQLAAERLGFWSKVLDSGRNALRIGAPIGIVNILSSTFGALLVTGALAAERRKLEQSNVRLAYRFLEGAESAVADIVDDK